MSDIVKTIEIEIGANFGPEEDAAEIMRDHEGVTITLMGPGPCFGDMCVIEGPRETVLDMLRNYWGYEDDAEEQLA